MPAFFVAMRVDDLVRASARKCSHAWMPRGGRDLPHGPVAEDIGSVPVFIFGVIPDLLQRRRLLSGHSLPSCSVTSSGGKFSKRSLPPRMSSIALSRSSLERKACEMLP